MHDHRKDVSRRELAAVRPLTRITQLCVVLRACVLDTVAWVDGVESWDVYGAAHGVASQGDLIDSVLALFVRGCHLTLMLITQPKTPLYGPFI